MNHRLSPLAEGDASTATARGSSTSPRRRTLTSALAVATVGVLLLGCTADTPHTSSDGAARFYDQEVTWTACDPLAEHLAEAWDDAGRDPATRECADIAVPLDWANPSARDEVQVAVQRVPATGTKTGSLLVNPGGPGGSGIEAVETLAGFSGAQDIGESYDLIGFDPRGIGRSDAPSETNPAECATRDDVPLPVQFGECIAANPLVHHMGTSSVARDMDVLRHLVGDEKLNYYGVSYGTVIGATYAELFPEKVGRMVLDSAEDARWATPEHTLEQAISNAESVERFASACTPELAEGACPFTSPATLVSYLATLDEHPLVGSSGREVDGAALADLLSGIAYQRDLERVTAYPLLARAASGDGAAVDELLGDDSAPSGSDDTIGTQAVVCHSFPASVDAAGLRTAIEGRTLPLLWQDRPADLLEQSLELSCLLLPEVGDDHQGDLTAAGSAPKLIIGTTGDPATPYRFAESLAAQLDDAHLLTLEGEGHGAGFSGSDCVDTAITEHLLTGKVPEKGAVCRG